MSLMVICDNSDVIEYDREISVLSNALNHTTQDANSIENKTLKY